MPPRPVKEFLVCGNVLMVREASRVDQAYSPDGTPIGRWVRVAMRPATLDEVGEYWETKGKLASD